MKDGNDEKMMSLFWLHWLHAPSLVSTGQSKLKLLSGNLISFFSNSDLDHDHRHLGRNPKLRLDVSYPCSMFGVNRPISIFSISDLDLDQRHLDSNLKLRLNVSYPYSKFSVNRPKQT